MPGLGAGIGVGLSGGGSSIAHPVDIFGVKLIASFDTVEFSGDQAVTTWTNLVSAAPDFISNLPGTINYVDADDELVFGINMRMMITALGTTAQPYDFWAIFPAWADVKYPIFSASNTLLVDMDGSSQYKAYAGSWNTWAAPPAGSHSIRLHAEGASSELWINGASQGTGDMGVSGILTNIVIAGDAAVDFSIRDWHLTQGTLTASEVADMEAYLASRV